MDLARGTFAYPKFGRAVVAGKFMPFHSGHRALILHAALLAEHVDVLLVANPRTDTVPPHVRALSIYEALPGKSIRVHIVDDIETDDTKPESSVAWAAYTRRILGYNPNLVVASEPYGKTWAEAMGAEFRMHDQERRDFPVSGTLCRADAPKYSDLMPGPTRRYMLPRIVVLGAESTGTTTLADALGEHYDTTVVPEIGRMMDEEDVLNGVYQGDKAWDDQRFLLCSRSQDAIEERMAESANGLLICDTDSLATAVWYDYYTVKGSATGNIGRDLRTAGMNQGRKHALYILTSPEGIEWENDGTRTGRDLRLWHHHQFQDILDNWLPDGVEYVVVEGSREQRLQQAVEEIDKVLDKHPSVC